MDHGGEDPNDPDRFRVTVTFDEQSDGKTVLTMRQLHRRLSAASSSSASERWSMASRRSTSWPPGWIADRNPDMKRPRWRLPRGLLFF